MTFSEFYAKGLLSGVDFGSVPVWVTVPLAFLIPAAAGYLLGSLNFALIVSKRLCNDDVREHGSGNAGLTNVLRVYGKKAALFTLLGDVLKAVVSVFIGACFFGRETAFVSGLFCMIGHIFPLYFRFKGGKGVLTAITLILCLDPLVGLILLLLFAGIVWATKYVSLGSIICAMVYPILLNRLSGGQNLLITVCSFLIAALVVVMHKDNIKRLLEGKENKLSLGGKKKSAPGEEEQKIQDRKDES